jgi:nucleotide-binding universal stress UspA family protein
MFKHILIPTDGSKLSEAALRAAYNWPRNKAHR